MLLIRLTFILLVIAATGLLGMYLLSHHQRYLRYFKRLLKCALFMVVLAGVLLVLRRLFHV